MKHNNLAKYKFSFANILWRKLLAIDDMWLLLLLALHTRLNGNVMLYAIVCFIFAVLELWLIEHTEH